MTAIKEITISTPSSNQSVDPTKTASHNGRCLSCDNQTLKKFATLMGRILSAVIAVGLIFTAAKFIGLAGCGYFAKAGYGYYLSQTPGVGMMLCGTAGGLAISGVHSAITLSSSLKERNFKAVVLSSLGQAAIFGIAGGALGAAFACLAGMPLINLRFFPPLG